MPRLVAHILTGMIALRSCAALRGAGGIGRFARARPMVRMGMFDSLFSGGTDLPLIAPEQALKGEGVGFVRVR